MVEVYSFSLLLSGKLLIWTSILIESLAGQSSLGCRPLVLITWNISCHSFLSCSVSIEKSDASLIVAPLYTTSHFSLAAFKILFVFEFCHFNYSVSWSGPLWVHLDWDPLCFLDLRNFFSQQVRKFSVITFSNRFSITCSSSSPLVSLLYRYFYVSCCLAALLTPFCSF